MAAFGMRAAASRPNLSAAPVGGGDGAWDRAYRFSLVVAFFYLLASMAGLVLNVRSVDWHCGVAIGFFVASLVAAYRLALSGGGLAAVTYFMLGSGLVFGFGTAYSVVAEGWPHQVFMSETMRIAYFPKVNLVNSVAVFSVLIAAYPLCGRYYGVRNHTAIRDGLRALAPFNILFLLGALVVLMLAIITFPLAENLILRSALSKLEPIVYLAPFLTVTIWRQTTTLQRILAIMLVASFVTLGVLSLSKTAIILPMVSVILGLWIGGRRRSAASLAISVILVLGFVLHSFTTTGRNHLAYDPIENSIGERLEIVLDAVGERNLNRHFEVDDDSAAALGRFSHTPFQIYLIQEFDRGRAGTSMHDIPVAMVPRFLWPGKPNVTRFGRELYGQFFRVRNPRSALAPTFSAEAYWNWGISGVVLISVIIGLEIGWLTRKWQRFVGGHTRENGVVLFAVPVVYSAFWVENWIAAHYIGGFITLAILITMAEIAGRYYLVARPVVAAVRIVRRAEPATGFSQ